MKTNPLPQPQYQLDISNFGVTYEDGSKEVTFMNVGSVNGKFPCCQIENRSDGGYSRLWLYLANGLTVSLSADSESLTQTARARMCCHRIASFDFPRTLDIMIWRSDCAQMINLTKKVLKGAGGLHDCQPVGDYDTLAEYLVSAFNYKETKETELN